VVLLHFWNRRRIPAPPAGLQSLHDEYRGKVFVLSIHDHSGVVPDVLDTVRREKITYAVGVDDYGYSADAAHLQSVTRARYRAGDFDTVLVDHEGRVAWTGRFAAQTPELTKRVAACAERVADATPAAALAVPAGALLRGPAPGAQAPALAASRWVRGMNVSADPARLKDLRGRVVVLRFSSVYVESSLAKAYAKEMSYVDAVVSLYGRKGLTALWVTPTSDALVDVEEHVGARKLAFPVAVDDEGRTYGRYGVSGLSANCVIGRDGRVHAGNCADTALFRVVKDLVTDSQSWRTMARPSPP
jgi:hypothetical protein